jgi:hypothetical protein
MERKLASEIDDREPGLHVSMAGRCPRQVFFSLTGVPKTEPMTLDSYMTLRTGNKVEELYIELLLAAGVTILSQQRVRLERDGETIHGTLDLVIEIPDEVRAEIPGLDFREVWELKSKNSRAMSWLLKKGGPEPDDGYVKQLQGYNHAAEMKLVPAPTHARGRLIYTAVGATKGEPLLSAYFVEYDRDSALVDLGKLAALGKAAREGRDPGIPESYDPFKFPCSYCEYKRRCFPKRGA